VNIPKLPEPGTQAWEDMIYNMREMNKYSGVIRAARESIEARGLNFDEEFAKWKKEKGK
jgi:hypothetical protein